MIKYDPGAWGVGLICRLRGSVLPKSLAWAIPNAILAAVLHVYMCEPPEDGGHIGRPLLGMEGTDKMWAGYTFVLGFLIVFRNNQAYSRFWDGALILGEVHALWFDAVSELFAFCSRGEAMKSQVLDLQDMLVKLASMLFTFAVQEICHSEDGVLEFLDPEGIDPESLAHLIDSENRTEVVIQWIQTIIVEHTGNGTLTAPAPIMSRAYQQFSQGMVTLRRARTIKETPFPFPYAQMITGMLIVHWIVTPLFASQVIASPWWAAIICFCVTASFWALLYIALEIDQPFGEDANSLPIKQAMAKFNLSLTSLQHPLVANRPQFMRPRERRMARVTTQHSEIVQQSQNSPQPDRDVICHPDYYDAGDSYDDESEHEYVTRRVLMADIRKSTFVHKTRTSQIRSTARQKPSTREDSTTGPPAGGAGVVSERGAQDAPATGSVAPSRGTTDRLDHQRQPEAPATQDSLSHPQGEKPPAPSDGVLSKAPPRAPGVAEAGPRSRGAAQEEEEDVVGV